MTKKKNNIKMLERQTYLAMIHNAQKTRIFRNFFVITGGRQKDITNNGSLSCAFFASSILSVLGFIKKMHLTVDKTIVDMKASGWREIKKPKIGAVLVWEHNMNGHRHLGFYIDSQRAISNSAIKRWPIAHHWTYKNKRKIEHIFWHKRLEK